MKKILKILLFFIGWVLSPFTWWNDAFINMPLSYLIANMLFYIFHLPFGWIVIASYWFTNAIGIIFMYFGGKSLILSSESKMKTAAFLIVFLIVYSIIMLYLYRHGMLLPLGKYFEKYCVGR